MAENPRSPFADFDRYVEERGVAAADVPEVFGQWLADATRAPVIGGPADESPTFVALPENEDLDPRPPVALRS